MKSLNVCLLNAGFDTGLKSAEHLLGRYSHVPKLAEALADQGHRVTVLQAFHRNETLQRGRVSMQFVAVENSRKEPWVEITHIADLTRELELFKPDVVHFFGLTMLPLRRSLGQWCAKNRAGLTASFHGGRPGRNPVTRWRQRQALSQTSAFFFPDTVVAKQWRVAGLVPANAQVTLLPEVSSPFAGTPKQIARRSLDVDGNPVFVWSGRLHPDKDPMTTLQGLQRISQTWPNLQLLMAYQSEEMLEEIEAFLESDTAFRKRVKLLGLVDHHDMETLFSAADFFVHSSRREWGSNSLVEALSCGAIPVVSDIPSLRALTENVAPAIRFDVGDVNGLAQQVLKLQLDDLGDLSDQVKSAFHAYLSYPVIAAGYSGVFEAVVNACTGGSRS